MTNLTKTHQWIEKRLDPTKSVVIDMTCGNGHDTLFLAQHCYHVYAIDIQAQAIENTKKRTRDFKNITTILKDHSTLDFHEFGPIDGAIYNLGYLPGGDKSIITTKETTLQSLHALVSVVTSFLVITCYPRHDGGSEETHAVQNFIHSLNKPITQFTYDKPLSPITYCIDLRNT
ncbi:SAM-dependent methyltransferase [Erysipelothrix larvae]|uniref:SAM-dependent methyltransferase n=1 Tax=Erysipelothrix larvae TaxID=1514105 RepID=A0A0X8H252_9FIRM|nr:SAM-dependent methyltransferase [Erysipelothrix larvae]